MTFQLTNKGIMNNNKKVKKKAMVLVGLLVTAVMSASLMLAAGKPAGAAATFTVNIPGDTQDADLADNLCDVNPFAAGKQCTLRAAIKQANATEGADTIRFNIPEDFGSGVKTINVGATGNGGLPTITEQVTIDGYTQPGASPNTLAKGTNAKLMVELNGTDATGADGDGLKIGTGASGTVIRGLVVNRFGNQGIQVDRFLGRATNVRIEGNFVGTDPSGTIALGNRGDGIEVGASESTVGGSTPDKRNLISGNDVDGLSITARHDVRVIGNLIGTKKDGVGALGNLFNGVDTSGNSGASISRNSIFSNGSLGIDLGVDGRTPNDPGDVDTGANGLQNFPVLTSTKTAGKETTIKGKLNSRPNTVFTVQFSSNPSGDEGETFIGQKLVTTDGSGNVSFTFAPKKSVAVGKTITATATRKSTSDTSEFSDPREVVAA